MAYDTVNDTVKDENAFGYFDILYFIQQKWFDVSRNELLLLLYIHI